MKTSTLLVWLLAVCLIVGIRFTSVLGDYVVRVRIHNFSNPDGLLIDNTCCNLSCGVPSCVNIYYCLRSLETSDGEGQCGDRNPNYNGEPLNLLNPLALKGLKQEWTGVQFYLEVIDDNGQQRESDLIGRVIHNIYFSNISLGVETEPSNFSRFLPVRSSIVFSFEVVCAENFYDRDCSRFCTKNCTCAPGFTGEFCHEVDNCHGINCGKNRRCIDGTNSHSCICNPGYTGENCNELLGATNTDILDETQASDKTLNIKAVLGGIIGLLVFLVLLLILVVGAMAIVIIRQKKKGNLKANDTSVGVLEKMEPENKADNTACTETIDNIAYKGITYDNKKNEGATDGKSHEDSSVYESIRFEQLQ